MHLSCSVPFEKKPNRLKRVSVYLVQRSIFIVLLGEARGHHTPLVTLEKATSINYFWQRGGGRLLQLHTHFKDTDNPSTPRLPLIPTFVSLGQSPLYAGLKVIFPLTWTYLT